MKDNKTNLPSRTYSGHLEIISGIKFTPREIDVIACLLGGRTSKSICQFLSIEEKTVETHKYNIMRKLDGNSKESIINFIEKSDKFSAVKKHYLDLLSRALFEKRLQEILALPGKREAVCSIVYWREQEEKTSFINQLEKHLKLAGFKVFLQVRENYKSLNHLIHKMESQSLDYIIYIVPITLLEQLRADDNRSKLEIFPFIQKASQNPGSVIFLLSDKDATPELPSEMQDAGYINCEEQGNYYFSVFEVLKKVMPDRYLDKIIADFRRQYETTHNSPETTLTQIWPEITNTSIEESPKKPFFAFFSKKGKWGLVLGSILFLSLSYFLAYNLNDSRIDKRSPSAKPQEVAVARSDLPIPADNTLLKRPKILAHIEEKLKGQEGIQTVALIGIGGIGKTILARQYMRAQKSAVIWEINAETQGSLLGSFVNLAYALSKTEEDKKILSELQDIQDPKEKEEKIILFVKKILKSQPDWFLIFDNVEKFTDIHKYFPTDLETWGTGKVIVTTRNTNVQNNKHVNHAIPIGQLSIDERLDLFNKITKNGNLGDITHPQLNEIKNLLEEIPPFPLDVSIAAYHLRSINISYSKYLEKITKHDKNFSEVEEDILNQSGDYTKTRYNIISLSINNIIHTDKHFLDLLFIISLIDSQNIPRDLLNTYIDEGIVDNFIYNLKKCSLIFDTEQKYENDKQPDSKISIHRSTQKIILSYLTKLLDLDKNKKLIQNIVGLLEKYIDECSETENIIGMKTIIPHLLSCLSRKQFSLLDKANLKSQLGHVYWATFLDIPKAKDFLTESLRIYKEIYKEPHLKIAWTLGELGTVYKLLGFIDHQEPQKFLEKSLEMYKACYGNENHQETGRLLVTLSGPYWRSQAYNKAQACLEKALSIYKIHYGEHHINTAWVYANYGRFYRSLGNYVKAKELLEKAILIHQKVDFQNFMDRAWPIINVGIIYKHCGNYAKAKEIIEEGLLMYEKHLGPDHIEIAWTNVHLAPVYGYLGNWNKAKEMIEKSLIVFRKFYGIDNVENAWVLKELGVVLEKIKDYKGSQAILEESLAIYQKHYGDDHVQVAFVMNDLGKTHLSRENLEEAGSLFEKAIEILRKKAHPKIYRVLENLSDLYLKKSMKESSFGNEKQERIYKEKSRALLKEVLEIIRVHFLPDSHHITEIMMRQEHL